MTDLLNELLQRVSTLERKLADTIVEGVVAEVQATPYRVRVNYGSLLEPQISAWLPVATSRSASANIWWPLEVGEAVTIISDSGNLSRGRVFQARYTDDHPPQSGDLDECLIQFGDGGSFSYNRASGSAQFISITDITIVSPNTTLDSEVLITQNLTVTGNSTAADHLSGAGISGKDHIHTGDSGGKTSKPE